jgi:hypothetical protein
MLLRLGFMAMLLGILTTAATAQQVEVRDGEVLVDDEPFFAIGMYSVGTRDLPALAEAGFNLAHTYGWEGQNTFEGGQEWLDTCEANGLKALVGLYRPPVKKAEFEGATRRIEKFRDHPALLAWHTMDEPGWEKEGDPGQIYMPAAYEVVKEHDPDHPVTAVFCHFADPKLFIDSVDIVQADYYPIPPIPANWFSGTGLRGIKQYADITREVSDGEAPFWYVAQFFDYSVSKQNSHEVPEEWQRGPNPREIRAMTYTAVASGARGVLYWSLSRAMGTDWHRDSLSRVERWNALVEVVAELHELMPVLTSREPEVIRQRDRVVSMVRSDGEDTYLIACNYERKPTDARLTVPGVRSATLEMPFRDETAQITDGTATVHFEPLEARVYRLVDDGNVERF